MTGLAGQWDKPRQGGVGIDRVVAVTDAFAARRVEAQEVMARRAHRRAFCYGGGQGLQEPLLCGIGLANLTGAGQDCPPHRPSTLDRAGFERRLPGLTAGGCAACRYAAAAFA